ncbi:MAG TPA: hypothetical protein VHP38_02175 [Ruminiclostridium sp.]|nr:hypothetical protein [Ruminiclostridium sp.]
MKIKYVVLCYVQHNTGEPSLRNEVEFQKEPRHEQIQDILNGIKLYDEVDLEIDYSSGAVLSDYLMPRKKSTVHSIYAVIEKRFYREVDCR